MSYDVPQAGKFPSVLEQYIGSITQRIVATEENIQKLSTIVNKIVNDQAVFDYKYEQAARVSAKLEDIIEKAHNRTDENSQALIKELNIRESRLNQSLADYRAVVERDNDNRKKDVDEDFTKLDARIDSLSDKMLSLQKLIWLAVGGGAVLLFIIQVILALIGNQKIL